MTCTCATNPDTLDDPDNWDSSGWDPDCEDHNLASMLRPNPFDPVKALATLDTVGVEYTLSTSMTPKPRFL